MEKGNSEIDIRKRAREYANIKDNITDERKKFTELDIANSFCDGAEFVLQILREQSNGNAETAGE